MQDVCSFTILDSWYLEKANSRKRLSFHLDLSRCSQFQDDDVVRSSTAYILYRIFFSCCADKMPSNTPSKHIIMLVKLIAFPSTQQTPQLKSRENKTKPRIDSQRSVNKEFILAGMRWKLPLSQCLKLRSQVLINHLFCSLAHPFALW